MRVDTYIKQPYPFYYEELKKVLLLLCFIAIASFLFTYLFDPFVVNVEEHKMDYLWIITLHSVMPIPVAFIYFFLLKKTVKNTENWTLGKEFLHLAIILFLIGIASFLIRDFIYTNPDNWSFRYLWEEIRNTFLVGILLLLIILPLNLQRLINKRSDDLKKLPINQQYNNITDDVVQITTPIKEENFELNIRTFLYAKVDGNYLEIYYDSSTDNEKKMKRLTLKEFLNQLNSYPFIFKTHRSYVVNLNVIESVSGNAQGYALHLKNYSNRTIPVSRSKIEEFNQTYINLKNN
ncbi:LytTR family transcriptional regulator [Tenacibaculum aiptasiae]|uniref:LytTR family transcriptional regulator n=1 Tax=Tenacibaculum aiptasiae TaxID=426481 RepID=A0A7J5AEF8_9FLAO|nr:LytTR family DNA-binding domain-containing protein [Tenacibaculum aiptasiae]KAB1155925.1 LytTR family transcriptional regulator [Tenacibaculum aiptasiae]